MSAARNLSDPTSLAERVAAGRPRFTFTVPESARSFPGDPTKITMQQLTVAEEEQAEKSAKALGKDNAGIECVKHSVVAIEGKPLTWENAAKERFIESLSPKVLRLVLEAYAKLHVPAKEAVDSFLGSMSIDV